jgi:type II secretory pathway component HofQ
MLITSMGIFGYLSKAHLEHSTEIGPVADKVAMYDEKIKIAKENIDANRKALKQMDEAVDQVMGRSTDEKGADKAVAIRRTQQKERIRLQSEISAEQKIIAAVSEERAPIAAEVRKVEAEVGPIKYIAALLYGDNPDQNLLEKAVIF